MSAFNFPRDMTETLKSLELVDNPNSWKVESLERSFVLTVVWHKSKKNQSNIARETVKSSFEGRSTEEKEEETTIDNVCRTRIATVNLNSCDRGVVSAGMNYLEPAGKTSKVFEERHGNQIRKTATNSGMTGSNNDMFVSEPLRNENMDRPSCSPNFSSCSTNSNQTNTLETQNTDFNNNSKLSGCYGSRFCSNQARCACGETFTIKEDAIRHVLFNCPVSLCFRVELDIKVNRIIDQWKSEANRISGRKWWHLYKTSGSPDVNMSFPENALDDIEAHINTFIEKSCRTELLDKTGQRFVLIEGLENLPTEEYIFTQ